MGVGNVKLVFVYWGDLPGAPFRLLLYMGLRSKDGDEHPQFWAGREDLAFALGRAVPPLTDDASRRERDAHFKAVKDAIQVLTRRGAIKTKHKAKPGRNAVYELNLSRRRWTETVPQMVDGNRAPVVDENPPGWGTDSGDTGDGNRAPEEEKEESGLYEGVDGEGSHQRAGDAHAREAENDDRSTRGDEEAAYRAAIKVMRKLNAGQVAALKAAAKSELGLTAPNRQIVIRAAELARASL